MRINSPAFFTFLFLAAALLLAVFPPDVGEPPPGKDVFMVTDMSGNAVKLEGPAARIMVITPVTWHYLAITASDQAIIMIPPYMKVEIKASVLGKIYPRLNSIPVSFWNNSGIAPFSVEQAMLINPDTVLSWDYVSHTFENVKFPGLVLIARDRGDKTKLFQVLGELSGRNERVDWLWARHQKEMDGLLASIDDDVEEKNLIVLSNTNLALWNNAGNPRFNQLFRQLKGINLAEGLKFGSGQNTVSPALINLEALLKLDPDIIYINPYTLASTRIDVPEIYKNPLMRGLKAVKNRRVYHMPSGAARLEGPIEEPLFMTWMYLTMHPELETSMDLRAKIKDGFMDMYDYQMSEKDIDDWLRLNENIMSSGYGRFLQATDSPPGPASIDSGGLFGE